MTIKDGDPDAERVEPGDVVAGQRVPAVHPGEILREDFLEPMGINVSALAGAMRVPRSRLNDLVLGRRAITAETALGLARFFGTTSDFWVKLQAGFDLEVAKQRLRGRGDAEVTPRAD